VLKTTATGSKKTKMMETILCVTAWFLFHFNGIARLKPACFTDIAQAKPELLAPGMGFEPMRT
jgi:hypothetical protein